MENVLLDVLLPQRCAACERPGAALCADCRASLIRLAPPICARCGSPGAWPVRRCAECSGRRLAFASARAAILYDEPARRLVLAWKERGRRRLAREAAELVAETLRGPTWRRSRASRPNAGAHARAGPPAGGGARARARHSSGSCPWSRCCGGPGVSSRAQRGLGLAERRRNVAGAFAPARASPTTRLPGRRRLHERSDGGSRRVGSPEGRCTACRGGDARAGRPIT